VEFLVKQLEINRKTTTSYLEILVDNGILSKGKRGKSNYYINIELFILVKWI